MNGRPYLALAALPLALAAAAPAAPIAPAVADVGRDAADQGAGGAAARQGVLFGVTADDGADLAERERETGRPLTAVRVFRRWGEPVVDGFVRDRADRHVFFLSVKARRPDGSAVRWADIAAARPGGELDGVLRGQARELRDLRRTVYFTFNHEPENGSSEGMGRPREYAAAWRRVVDVYREEKAANVRFVWTMTDAAFGRDAARYYPGDPYIDQIGVDAYNWFDCRGRAEPWRSLATLIEPHRRFGLRHPGKGLMILESGTVEDRARPNRKARWLADAAALFTRPDYAQYTAYLHWDDRHRRQPEGPDCDWDYRSSDAALRAWRAAAAAPVFAAAGTCAPGRCAARRPDDSESGLPLLAAGGGVLALAAAGGGLLWLRRRRGGRTA